MKSPLIEINDWSGGMSLNPTQGRSNQFHIGHGVDFSSKRGCLAPGYAYLNMKIGESEDMGGEFPFIIQTAKDGRMYLVRDDSAVYYRNAAGTIAQSASAVADEAARGCVEYKSYLYVTFKTAIYKKDLTQAADAGWAANWHTGMNDTSHPMWVSADNKMYIGNGNEVLVSTGVEDTPSQALDLVDNWEIRDLCDFGFLYLAIASSYYTSTHKPVKSRIFLWDRSSGSWNDEIIIPEPEIKKIIYDSGYLWVWAGRSCNLYVIPDGSRKATKIWSFVKENPTEEFQVHPGAVVARNGTIYFGLSDVDSTSMKFNPAGIYSFPANPEKFSLNLIWKGNGYDESIQSLGIYREAVETGGDILHFSRKDKDDNERLVREKIYASDTSYYSAAVEAESFRYSAPVNKKIFTEAFVVEFETLPAGTKTSLYYGIDGADPTTAVFEDFTTTSATKKIVYKKLQANNIKLKLKVQGSTTTANRQFITKVFVTGHLISRI